MNDQQRCTKCGTLIYSGSCPSCLEANRRAWDAYSESKPVANGTFSQRPFWQRFLIVTAVVVVVKFIIGIATGSIK